MEEVYFNPKFGWLSGTSNYMKSLMTGNDRISR